MYERPQNYVDIFVYFVWHLRCAPIRRSGQGSHLVPANLHLQDWHFFPHTATPIINWQSLKSSSRKQKNTVHWPLSNFITRQIPEIWLNWDAVRLAVASCLAKVSSFFISYINWMANTRHQKKKSTAKSVNFLSPIWWPTTTKAKRLFWITRFFIHTPFRSGYYGVLWGSSGKIALLQMIYEVIGADDLIGGAEKCTAKILGLLNCKYFPIRFLFVVIIS